MEWAIFTAGALCGAVLMAAGIALVAGVIVQRDAKG